MKFFLTLFILLTVLTLTTHGTGDKLNAGEQDIKIRMKALSETMQKGGSGGEGYTQFLAPDFTRWTVGSKKINNRAEWSKSISDWFEMGWRVSKSQNVLLELHIAGEFAFSRRIATETFSGPKGENNTYESGVVEVWVKQKGKWFLLKASVSSKKVD